MKVMYVISPDYLLPFEEQSANYSFNIKGFRLFVKDEEYPNVADAKSELFKTNVNDIVGFIILINDLSYFISEINEFLKEADRICKGTNRRVVIGTLSSKGDRHFADIIPTSNLKVFRVSNIDILTDHVIHQELFGTIIKGRAPYEFMNPNKENKLYNDLPKLRYKPIFSKHILSVLDDVMVISDDFNKVLSYDTVYRNLLDEEEDRILAFIRMVKVASSMHLEIAKDVYNEMLEEINASEHKLIYKGLLKECGGYYE